MRSAAASVEWWSGCTFGWCARHTPEAERWTHSTQQHHSTWARHDHAAASHHHTPLTGSIALSCWMRRAVGCCITRRSSFSVPTSLCPSSCLSRLTATASSHLLLHHRHASPLQRSFATTPPPSLSTFIPSHERLLARIGKRQATLELGSACHSIAHPVPMHSHRSSPNTDQPLSALLHRWVVEHVRQGTAHAAAAAPASRWPRCSPRLAAAGAAAGGAVDGEQAR